MRASRLRPVLAGALLALPASLLSLVPVAPASAATDRAVRIATYNIRAGVPFVEFKAAVGALRPMADLIGLQEIGSNERNKWLQSEDGWAYHTADDVQQNPIIWRRSVFHLVGRKDYLIAPDRNVAGGPQGRSWATGVRLLDRSSGRQISVLNVHLVKGAVKGGLPVPGRRALFALFAEQVRGTVAAVKAEREVPGTDAVYLLGDFNVGFEADLKRRHKLLPYRQYKLLGMRSMWQASPLLKQKLGTHSDALIDQVWTTEDSSLEEIHRGIRQSDHWPAVATYELLADPTYVPDAGAVGFAAGDLQQSAREGDGGSRDPNLVFDLVGDMGHGYLSLEVTGTATLGTTYGEGDLLIDASELYDEDPTSASIFVDFQGDEVREPDETFTIRLVDPVGVVITPGFEAVTGTISDDD